MGRGVCRTTLRNSPETMEKIEKRVARAEYEISRAKEFDRQIVNDDLEKAEAEALQIVNDFLSDEKDK